MYGIFNSSWEYINFKRFKIESRVSGFKTAKHLSSNSLCIALIPKRSANGAKISKVSKQIFV